MYYLMNKNEKIAKFSIDEMLGEPVIEEQYVTLPSWYGDLSAFIVNRRAPKHRENIEKLLEMSGCDTLQGFLDISHALSLIDTFWVKPVDSRLEWEDLSLYTHPFNDVIAKTAFEGGLHGRHLSTTSPEYGTDGPRIGDNWVNIAVACLTPETRKTLNGLREFAFEKHPKYNLPDWRLEALTAEMHAIIDAILEKDALRTKQMAVKK